mgnify:CR=1 FL=1
MVTRDPKYAVTLIGEYNGTFHFFDRDDAFKNYDLLHVGEENGRKAKLDAISLTKMLIVGRGDSVHVIGDGDAIYKRGDRIQYGLNRYGYVLSSGVSEECHKVYPAGGFIPRYTMRRIWRSE